MDVKHSCVCGRGWPSGLLTSSRPLRLSTDARKRVKRRTSLPPEQCDLATARTVTCNASGSRGQDRDLTAKAVSVGVGDADAAGLEIVGKKNAWSKFDKEIATIAIPTILTTLLFPLASSVDAAIVGKLGLAQLSAVGLAGMFFTISNTLFQFLGQLATPAVAQAKARGDDKEVARTMVQNISIAFLAGICLSFVTFFCAEGVVANVLKPAAAVYPFAVQYLKAVALSCPASLLIPCLSGIYRGLQDAKSTLVASIASTAVNLGLDCLFVFGFGWGVTGAGVATTVSLYTSMLILFVGLLRKGYVKLADFANPPKTDGLLSFFIKGLAWATRSICGYGLLFLGTVYMGRVGVTESAAFTIARQMAVLALTSYSSLEMSSQALCAKYLGKGDTESAKMVMFRMLQLGMTSSAIVGTVMLAFSSNLTGLYTSNAVVIDQVCKIAPVLFFLLPLDACAGIMDGVLLASHQSNYVSMALITTSVIGICAMSYCWQVNALTLLSTWVIIKTAFLGRGFFGFYKLFVSDNSPYKDGPRPVPS